MKILRLAWINYKRMIKDIGSTVSMILMAIIVISSVHFMVSGDKGFTDTTVAFNVQDRGNYAKEILESINQTENVFYNQKEKAMELLQKNDVVSVYLIPEDFTESIKKGEKPQIERLEIKEGKGTAIAELKLNNEINHRLKEELLLGNGILEDTKELSKVDIKTELQYDKKPISSGLFLTTLLIIYFIILSANNIATEILNQRKEKTLQRALTTANRGYEIMGSFYLAMFFHQVSLHILVLIIEKFIIGYNIVDFHIIFINIALASLVSISIGLFVTRIFKNAAVVSIVVILICVSTTFLSMLALGEGEIRKIPWIFYNLAKFTPQYWLFNSIENSKLFPNALILMLMAVALFTAGNFKLRKFANK